MSISKKQILSLILALCVSLAMVPQQTMAKSGGSKGFSGKSPTTANKLIKIAKSKIGKPYSYGAAGPNRFDCSGFVAYCMKRAGIKFKRGTAASYNKRGYRVGSVKKARKGDIVLYSAGGRISHCGIYIGGGKVIHASYSRGIRVQSLRIPGLRVRGFVRTFNRTNPTTITLKASDSSRKVRGTKYQIVGKKFKKTVKVNKKGVATLANLKAGTYKIVPLNVAKKYRKAMTKTVKVKKQKTTKVAMKNVFARAKALAKADKKKARTIAKAKAEAEAAASAAVQ